MNAMHTSVYSIFVTQNPGILHPPSLCENKIQIASINRYAAEKHMQHTIDTRIYVLTIGVNQPAHANFTMSNLGS
jgi:hypothetical protein